MPEQWNRKQRRKMARYGIGQQALDRGIDEAWRKAEENTYRAAWAGMILALNEHFGFPADRIHDLAVETMKNINGSSCPSELVDLCKARTGFDVDEPLDSFEVNMGLMEAEI